LAADATETFSRLGGLRRSLSKKGSDLGPFTLAGLGRRFLPADQAGGEVEVVAVAL
jgi:hypothetical protein